MHPGHSAALGADKVLLRFIVFLSACVMFVAAIADPMALAPIRGPRQDMRSRRRASLWVECSCSDTMFESVCYTDR
jgi:hypothetical protein